MTRAGAARRADGSAAAEAIATWAGPSRCACEAQAGPRAARRRCRRAPRTRDWRPPARPSEAPSLVDASTTPLSTTAAVSPPASSSSASPGPRSARARLMWAVSSPAVVEGSHHTVLSDDAVRTGEGTGPRGGGRARTTSVAGSSWSSAWGACRSGSGSRRSSSVSTATAPAARSGAATVVSAGVSIAASGMSSKPTTLSSPRHLHAELGQAAEDAGGHEVVVGQHRGGAAGQHGSAAPVPPSNRGATGPSVTISAPAGARGRAQPPQALLVGPRAPRTRDERAPAVAERRQVCHGLTHAVGAVDRHGARGRRTRRLSSTTAGAGLERGQRAPGPGGSSTGRSRPPACSSRR